jgi:hypothetical protein
MPKRPPLTMFKQPVENVTLYSNVQGWLMNTAQNLGTVYGPNAWDILARMEDEETTNRLLKAEVQQLSDLRSRAREEVRTAYVLAAGASLTRYRAALAHLKKTGYLVASPTVVPWIVKQAGVTPDLTVVVDKSPQSVEQIRFSGVLEDTDSALLMSPEAPPQLPVLYGRHRTYWIRTAIPGPDGSMDWEPYSIFQSFLGRAIEYRLAQLGCVTNMMVSALLALREHAGWDFDQIVLVGADYGYWRGFSRIPKDGSPTLEEYDRECPSNFRHRTIMTDRRMVRYKASLMLLWLQTKARIYSMSHGILNEFPQVSEKRALADNFPAYPEWDGIHERILKWMEWFRTESGLVQGVEESAVKERAYQVTFTEDEGAPKWAVVTAEDADDAIRRARGVTRASEEATATYRDLGPTKGMSVTKEVEELIR